MWDLHPGYLDRPRLLAEHREIHGLFVVALEERRGYGRHPETLRWREFLGALAYRHELVAAEMGVRGYRHRTPAPVPCSGPYPSGFLDAPADQFRLLAEKFAGRSSGRIPLPRSPRELWSQHELSVLAREPDRRPEAGPRAAAGTELGPLASDLVRLLRTPPSPVGLRRAVGRLWAGVSGWAGPEDRDRLPRELLERPGLVLARIAELARTHFVTEVLATTALSDLVAWAEPGSAASGQAAKERRER